MQCMMKEVCAQCLQPQIDPATGERTVVFSCFNQDQALDRVDFSGAARAAGQNGAQEKLTAQWIDRALRRLHARGARGCSRSPARATWGSAPVRLMGSGGYFAGHHLAADFAALVGRGVHVHVPLAGFQILHLRVGQRTVPWTGLGGFAADRHHHAGIRAGAAGPWKCAAVAGPLRPHIGHRVGELSSCRCSAWPARRRCRSTVVGGTSDLPFMVALIVDHCGRGGRQEADGRWRRPEVKSGT